MSLLDIFRSFIGERDVALSTLDGFLSTPDSSGINFYLPVPVFKALREGKGNALQKIQLIVLNMLGNKALQSRLPMASTSARKMSRGWILSRQRFCGCQDAFLGDFSPRSVVVPAIAASASLSVSRCRME